MQWPLHNAATHDSYSQRVEEKEKLCLSTLIFDQSAHLSAHMKRITKKKIQILFFTAATKKDKDGFDIDNSTKDFIVTNNSSR